MKYIKRIFALLVLLMPLSVSAVENTVDNSNTVNDEFTIILEEELKTENDVDGSSIFAGNKVIATNTVNGINMLFGNNVNYQAESEYLLLAGNVVELSGNIQNDGFVFGNLVTFKEDFTSNRDLFIFASEVELKGIINRDVTIFAGNVVLDNIQILGNINVYATTIEVKDNTVIDGTLSYNEDIEVVISQNAQINKTTITEKLVEGVDTKDVIYTHFIDYAGMIVIFLALAFIFPLLFRKIESTNKEINLSKFFSLFGFGALLLIAAPMLAITLFTTVVGTSLGLLILAIYIILICLTNILFGYLIGYIIWKKFIKKENNILLIGLIGITLVTILQLIPIIGEFVTLISLMVGLGIVLNLLKKH